MYTRKDIHKLSTAFLERVANIEGFVIDQLSKKDVTKLILMCTGRTPADVESISNRAEKLIIHCNLELLKRKGFIEENSRGEFRNARKPIK